MMQAAVGPTAGLATVCIGRLNFDLVDRQVSRVYGDWPLPSAARSLLNLAFPRIALRDLSRQCESALRAGGFVHYLAEDIRPWIQRGRVAISVHGNPQATIESDHFYTFGSGYRMLVRHNLKVYGKVAATVVQSEYVRRGLEEYGYEGTMTTIPPAIDPLFSPAVDRGALRAQFGLPIDRTIVLSVSSAEKRKNLGVIPRVMDLLPPNYLLVRIGPSIRGATSFRHLSDHDVANLYAAADVLLFPTLEEGFGLPVIEAFASGLPVVASNIPVVEEVSGGSAVLVDPLDPRALATACTVAIDERDARVASGLRRAQNFTLGKLAARLDAFYRRAGS
jgi:glycosyltransferase involved in cell wall biosynthesis